MQALTVSVLLLVAISGVASRFHHGIESLGRARRSSDVTCNEARRFRRFDGQCNNLENTNWGSVGQHFERIAAAAYNDAAGFPRTNGVNNQPLPAVRVISQLAHPSDSTTDNVTLMVMQWGQFMDHDITATAESEENGAPLVCTCGSSNSHCFNIPIDTASDEHFKSEDCLEFARSEAELVENSDEVEVLEQTNVVTAYIDASMVYGSSNAQANNLRRTNKPGSLKTRNNVPNQGPFLPRDPNNGCILEGDDEFCLLAGDFRVNEMPGLAALHTIFVREHNRIARFFRNNNNNNWSENKIYQETRKIVGAMVQHINYNEYLPIVLAPSIMEQFRLGVDDCFKYDPELRADIINSFATAAFRFGHSQIPEGVNHGENNFVALETLFSRPGSLFERFDDITGALAKDRSMTSDGFFARSVTRHLVLGPGAPETDLISRNLQRGRDHGLPSYNTFRQACGLDAITSFDQLDANLANVYTSVDDIDLFTGGMIEERLEGGLLGPTFSCIMGRQFNKLKFGDRFFYTTQDKNTRFTYSQLKEIKKITLSKIICTNSENKNIQPNIFLPADYESNSMTACNQLPRVNLRKWL